MASHRKEYCSKVYFRIVRIFDVDKLAVEEPLGRREGRWMVVRAAR